MTSVESSGADADMRRLDEEGAQANAANMLTVAQALDDHGLLRQDVTVQQAADILFTLCSPHVHALLRRYRGWTVEQYREWLRATLQATLLSR